MPKVRIILSAVIIVLLLVLVPRACKFINEDRCLDSGGALGPGGVCLTEEMRLKGPG